jgi:methyl-accepting chemotaxis protein
LQFQDMVSQLIAHVGKAPVWREEMMELNSRPAQEEQWALTVAAWLTELRQAPSSNPVAQAVWKAAA